MENGILKTLEDHDSLTLADAHYWGYQNGYHEDDRKAFDKAVKNLVRKNKIIYVLTVSKYVSKGKEIKGISLKNN
jgi:aspartate/tyrosine/aromatic aminotransferase